MNHKIDNIDFDINNLNNINDIDNINDLIFDKDVNIFMDIPWQLGVFHLATGSLDVAKSEP